MNHINPNAHAYTDYRTLLNDVLYKERVYSEANMDYLPTTYSEYQHADFVTGILGYVVQVPEEKRQEYFAKVRSLCECLYPLRCPEEGSFTAWKIGRTSKIETAVDPLAVHGLCLIELEVPEDAKRSSCYGNKCRCDKALVKSITELSIIMQIPYARASKSAIHYDFVETSVKFTKAYSAYIGRNSSAVYKVGEMVIPDKFDDNRWRECSSGIHFFMSKQEAMQYALESLS